MTSLFEGEQIRLKEDIIHAALHLAETEGWSAVSIRRIATKIEYSTTKVYELFDNKNHLVLELIRMGHGMLATQLETAIQAETDPQERAIAMARAYCRFAWDNAALYRIIYGMDGVPFGAKETLEEGMRIGEIGEGVLSGIFLNCEADVLERHVYAAWGLLHGICSLFMSGKLYGQKEQAENLAIQSFFAMVRQ